MMGPQPTMGQQPMMGPQQGGLPPELMMTEEEWNQVFDYLSTLDEKQLKELEEYGRQVLTDVYGLDPDTLQPLPGGAKGQQLPPAPSVPAPRPPEKKPEHIIPAENKIEVRNLIKGLIERTASLRAKIALMYHELPPAPWIDELNELIVYLSVLDKNEHYEQLLLPEFAELLTILKKLYQVFALYEPLFIELSPLEHEFEDDPYEILGVSVYATQEDIEQAYTSLTQTKNPEEIKQKLEQKGLSTKDINRAVKEARLSLNIIQDAYEKLRDPKIRQHIDRELYALHSQTEQTRYDTYQAFNMLDQAFAQALQQQLIQKLEALLKKYEPQELARKKEMLEAEAKRRQEQQIFSTLRPLPTIGGPFEQKRPIPGHESFIPAYGPLGPSAYPPYQPPQPTTPTTEEKKGGKTGGEGEKKKEDKKKEKKEEEKKKEEAAKKEQKTKKTRAKIEKSQAKIMDVFKTIETDCNKLHEYMDKKQNQDFFAQLPGYMHAQDHKKPIKKPATKIPAKKPTEKETETAGEKPEPQETAVTEEDIPSEETVTEEASEESTQAEITSEEIAQKAPTETETPVTEAEQPTEETTEVPLEKPASPEEPAQINPSAEETALKNQPAPQAEKIETAPEKTAEEEMKEKAALLSKEEQTKRAQQQQTEKIKKELEEKKVALETFLKQTEVQKFEKDLQEFKKLMSDEDVASEQKQQVLQKWHPWYVKCQLKIIKELFEKLQAAGEEKTPLHPDKKQFLIGSTAQPGILTVVHATIKNISGTIEEINTLLRKSTQQK